MVRAGYSPITGLSTPEDGPVPSPLGEAKLHGNGSRDSTSDVSSPEGNMVVDGG